MGALEVLRGGPTGDPAPSAAPRMPAFAAGKQAHHHSIHSALATLSALGIGAHRIEIERTGRDAAEPDTVVGQTPSPGEPLLPDMRVHLRIAGLGFTHALPVGMWDSGGETHIGTREILQGFDDPLEKLKHWFHEGAPLFHIAPDDPAACARWLLLFGVEPERWPKTLWYRLASLIAGMAQYACDREGCAFVLKTLLDLPVQQLRYKPCYTHLPQSALSGLGQRSSRLGVDLIMGDSVEEPALLEIEIGPVPLPCYERFAETPEGTALLRQTLELVLPVATRHEVRWSVLDPSRPPQLGVREGNSRLGINTHMGRALAGVLPDSPLPEAIRAGEQDA